MRRLLEGFTPDDIFAAIANEAPRIAVFTTFTFSPAVFSERYLRRLQQCGCEQIVVLVDSVGYAQSPTFTEVSAVWKKDILSMYKYSTQKHHAEILEHKLMPAFGEMAVDEIGRRVVQSFVAEMNSRKYSPHSIHHYHTVLSSILTKAVEWGYIASNPARNVEKPTVVAVRPKWILSVIDARSLLDKLALLPKTIVGLALLTGMRRGELFAVKWQDFDSRSGMLHVRQAVYENVIDTPKTAKSKRAIPLCGAAVQLLEAWRAKARKTEPSDFIFSAVDNKPKEPKQILRDYVFPACTALELPRATWLTFRRTFSSWSHDAGVPLKVVAELMGHSSVDTTGNVYTQVLQGSLRMAVDKVGNELFSNCSVVERTDDSSTLVN